MLKSAINIKTIVWFLSYPDISSMTELSVVFKYCVPTWGLCTVGMPIVKYAKRLNKYIIKNALK